MTKSEYKKELYTELIKILQEDIEEANKKQARAKDPFENGRQVGKREESERIIKLLGGN